MELGKELFKASLVGDDGRKLTVLTTETKETTPTFVTMVFDDSADSRFAGKLIAGMEIGRDSLESYSDEQARARHVQVVRLAILEPITEKTGGAE